MKLLIEQILNGLAMGSIYAIITLGLALVYGVMRILHVAHASVYTVGAYAGVYIFHATGSLALAFLDSMILCAVLGVLIERLVYFPLLKCPPYVPLIASIAVMLLAPLAASLIQMAISRAREFEADRGGAEISGDPQALASALQKIHRYASGMPMEAAERHPETAQMMIMNPLSGGGLRGLFSTHPSTEERVERLMAMAGSGQRP